MSNHIPRPAGGTAVTSRSDMGWQERAACRGHDPELFFASEAESATARQRREARAKRICAGCPVRTPCLEYRLDFEYQRDGGIWGAMDEDERWKLHKNRIRTAKRRAAA